MLIVTPIYPASNQYQRPARQAVPKQAVPKGETKEDVLNNMQKFAEFMLQGKDKP